MTQYNSLNVRLSKSKLKKLKSAIKIGTEATLHLSPDMIGDSNDEANFPHKLLITDRQVSRLLKAFANNSSANIKIIKTRLPKMAQLGRSLGRLFGSLLKTELPLMENVLKPLAESVLMLLRLAAAADAEIHAKTLGSRMTTLIVLNEETADIILKNLVY